MATVTEILTDKKQIGIVGDGGVWLFECNLMPIYAISFCLLIKDKVHEMVRKEMEKEEWQDRLTQMLGMADVVVFDSEPYRVGRDHADLLAHLIEEARIAAELAKKEEKERKIKEGTWTAEDERLEAEMEKRIEDAKYRTAKKREKTGSKRR